ncbi:SpoIIE family protein phosphatase, partial [bacterium]|nr:SpoIIE family protein phosphatase [bacterium]
MVSSLYVELPHNAPFEVRLDKEVVTVGRAEENVLELGDRDVSRQHFTVERQNKGWILKDRGSRNGTLVNRVKVVARPLIDGDRIEVGSTILTFRAQASKLAISTSEVPRPGDVPAQAPPSPSPDAPPPSTGPPPISLNPMAVTRQTPRPPPSETLVAASAASLFADAGAAEGGFGVSPVPTNEPATPATSAPVPAGAAHPTTTPPTAMARPGAATKQPPSSPPGAVVRPARPPSSSRLPAAAKPPGKRATTAFLMPAPREDDEVTEELDVSGYQKPKGSGAGLGSVMDVLASDRVKLRWRKLAELTSAITAEGDLRRLLEQIVDGVLSLVPAKGAFLLLLKGDQLELQVARNLDKAQLAEPDSPRFSRQICREAIAKKKPVLTLDAAADAQFKKMGSVVDLKLKALLCVPFGFGGEVMGVVYMDEPQIDPRSPKADDEIDLVAAFGDLAGIAFANARRIEEAKNRERVAETLKIASRIQRKLLPDVAPVVDGLEIAGRMLPAEEIGGDLYDFFGDVEGDVFISIGDVSGKGVGAGIVMASVRALLRSYAERVTTSDKILVSINRALVRDLEKGSFVSMLLFRWSRHWKVLAYAGAGHEHLIVARAKTGKTETIRCGGVVLGLSADVTGRIEEKRLDLEKGDLRRLLEQIVDGVLSLVP